MISKTGKSCLWEIYRNIGRSCAGEEMTKAQLEQLISDLRSTATIIENDLKEKSDD